MEGRSNLGRFDSVSLAGIAIFGALSILLTTLSQALGLNFPIIPYLQFDFGEVAIILAFFIFGPIPAFVSALIEFLTLMVIGQNIPIGPVLKLMAIASSLVGVWAGTRAAARMKRSSLSNAVGFAASTGVLSRVAIMTVANYYLLVFLFHVTQVSALGFTLTFTGVFNILQLLLVVLVSYLVIRVPQVRNLRTAGRRPWLISLLQRQSAPAGDVAGPQVQTH